ncbi:uncharacterized protein N0V89_007447 [Didymosphaeria variabile]|uniref:Cupredoxin n=1 Tax=Didymosphaeria variabile TaxID=1932322 RepID=A0A9W8XKW4_9PLEO|nr:uncharacterized protein N0V89_007447 [Didymosphaeria variabile]KAJ4352101.1 hypothetical protein N0V89_007447 [Didymosphaeria variabile]
MQLTLSSFLLAASVSALPAEPMLGTSGLRGEPSPTMQGGPVTNDLKARQAKVIPVVVGGPQDTFNPNSVTAAVGDIVQYQFSNGNHTATQSTPEAPCTPLNGGVNSGHIPFQDGATGPHCQEGQVMIINPTGPQQVLDFVKAAQGTDKSTDGTAIAGGTTSQIELTNAAFVPAPAEDAAGGGGAAPPAAPPAAGNASQAATTAGGNSTQAANGTTTGGSGNKGKGKKGKNSGADAASNANKKNESSPVLLAL